MTGYPLGENGVSELLGDTVEYLEKPLVLDQVAQVMNRALENA